MIKFRLRHNDIIRYTMVAIMALGLYSSLSATHNRAGEITYKQIGPLTIEATITTYTKTSSSAADRDSLEIFWGDGTSEVIPRKEDGVILPNDVKRNEYIRTHTYPGRGTFTISFNDPNRVGNILNVNYPNSIDIPFFLSTTFTLLNPQFQGFNNSVQLLQPPIDIACVNRPFIHNPNAFDPDGDSIAYELVEPLMEMGVPVPKYKYPNEIIPGPNNQISIDPITGNFEWISPPQVGEYNIAIRVKEYRKGVLINSIIRDMQIRITNCDNRPPVIESMEELCVIAGEVVDIPIQLNDPDIGQKVQLLATGGPLNFKKDSAYINNLGNFTTPVLNTSLRWQTTCNHVRKEYYQFVLRGVDDFFSDSSGLATFYTIRVKVIAPPPDSLKAEAINGDIHLEWQLPYTCESANNNYFRGFSIWRKNSPNPIIQDTCTTGLENYGYTEVVFLTNQNDGDKYFYIDENLEKGITYCYRIQGEFALNTSSGSLYNRTESLPSDEICLQISRDLPLITKVSVINTDQSAGQIHLRWSKPLAEELDTIENPGPYRIEILRSLASEESFASINSSIQDFSSLSESLDTNFFDTNINTLEDQYKYKINFYTRGDLTQPYGSSADPTSIFIEASPSDKRVNLVWQYEAPWTNYNYKVYRSKNGGTPVEIGQTSTNSYLDLALDNDSLYCYYIEAEGSYSFSGIEDPLFNLSQVSCVRPFDNLAPCAPKIQVTNICDNFDPSQIDNLLNTIRWQDVNLTCDRKETIDKYNVYFSNEQDGEFTLIGSVEGDGVLLFDHQATTQGLAGCYAVTALDSLGNESEFSNIVCKENCPIYELPNAFTPNGDGANELFVPIKNLFINEIELTIFNEWGIKVFYTKDPEIRWGGTINNEGEQLPPGTYYYVCKVMALANEISIENLPTLQGFIQLVR